MIPLSDADARIVADIGKLVRSLDSPAYPISVRNRLRQMYLISGKVQRKINKQYVHRSKGKDQAS